MCPPKGGGRKVHDVSYSSHHGRLKLPLQHILLDRKKLFIVFFHQLGGCQTSKTSSRPTRTGILTTEKRMSVSLDRAR